MAVNPERLNNGCMIHRVAVPEPVLHEMQWEEVRENVQQGRAKALCSCNGWEREDGCVICMVRAFNDHAGIPNVGTHP